MSFRIVLLVFLGGVGKFIDYPSGGSHSVRGLAFDGAKRCVECMANGSEICVVWGYVWRIHHFCHRVFDSPHRRDFNDYDLGGCPIDNGIGAGSFWVV